MRIRLLNYWILLLLSFSINLLDAHAQGENFAENPASKAHFLPHPDYLIRNGTNAQMVSNESGDAWIISRFESGTLKKLTRFAWPLGVIETGESRDRAAQQIRFSQHPERFAKELNELSLQIQSAFGLGNPIEWAKLPKEVLGNYRLLQSLEYSLSQNSAKHFLDLRINSFPSVEARFRRDDGGGHVETLEFLGINGVSEDTLRILQRVREGRDEAVVEIKVNRVQRTITERTGIAKQGMQQLKYTGTQIYLIDSIDKGAEVIAALDKVQEFFERTSGNNFQPLGTRARKDLVRLGEPFIELRSTIEEWQEHSK